MNIQDEIKKLMQENGVSYRDVAEKWRCSFQNVWQRLNNRPAPAFYAMRKILNAFDYDFEFQALEPGALDSMDKAAFLESMEETETSYSDVEAMLAAMKIGIAIVRK